MYFFEVLYVLNYIKRIAWQQSEYTVLCSIFWPLELDFLCFATLIVYCILCRVIAQYKCTMAYVHVTISATSFYIRLYSHDNQLMNYIQYWKV